MSAKPEATQDLQATDKPSGALASVTLDDRYAARDGQVLVNGMQAIVRLVLEQHRHDVAAGLDTAGFVSGYRGSPVGGLDLALVHAGDFLDRENITFRPGVNEDLAATAVWGTQQIALNKVPTVDGVFGLWYGKGPGVDRSGDAFKHGNLSGTMPHGGVLIVAGDDHVGKSSTTCHQSEFAFVDAQIPVFAPADLTDVIDYGLAAFALSRFSGLWTAMTLVTEIADSTGPVPACLRPDGFQEPEDWQPPAGGLHIRWPDTPKDQEHRIGVRLEAARAFARANRLDRVVERAERPRLALVAAGKGYTDLLEAFDLLGLDGARRAELGLSLYKVAMVWPLETEGLAAFAAGHDEILVVEEKRALIEPQLKDALYHRPERLPISGKHTPDGVPLLPVDGELDPLGVALALGHRLLALGDDAALDRRLARLERIAPPAPAPVKRTPYFCSGCPHNTSTRVPEGSHAHAGIGCHYMAQWMDRATETVTQMGAEGANWIGQCGYVTLPHVFQNLGDGTYFHSGLLAIRAAVAAKVPITYKILYNDAVAMTGGQQVDGTQTPDMIARQVEGEGVSVIAIVSDQPDKYDRSRFPRLATFHHRDALDQVQRRLREIKGVTVLIYDQTCAAEKRRRRKRGLMDDPARRVLINEAVCEGCGDCSVQSNCLSVVPIETEYGTKRQIDQTSCNKDFSCLKGFCPSFVTVEGGRLKTPHPRGGDTPDTGLLPEPARPATPNWSILVTGVGGTGVVTVGALLAMAAHLEGRAVSVMDQTGLAQKGGAVTSHIRLAVEADRIHAPRIPERGADLVLACDVVVAASSEARVRMAPARTRVLANSHELITADFTKDRKARVKAGELVALIGMTCGPEAVESIDATGLALALVGDSLSANLLLLGLAYQRGLVPLSAAAIERAIALNGAGADRNRRAFRWGRLAAVDRARVEAAAAPPADALTESHRRSASLDEAVTRRLGYLTRWGNAAWAERYRAAVTRLRAAEDRLFPGRTLLARAAVENLHKLMVYKDEYEVARLYSHAAFHDEIRDTFEGPTRLVVHLAPPLLSRVDPATGRPRKRAFGPWVFRLFDVLRRFKVLRGTPFDPFGWTAERRAERALVDRYLGHADEIVARLSSDTYDIAVALMSLPAEIRGYGPIKRAAMARVAAEEKRLLDLLRRPPEQAVAAE